MNNMIVNADDFGLSTSANLAIVDCFKKGIINRTILMVNGPCVEEAVKLARENKFEDKVGLHLNLTFGRPLSKNILNTELCKEDGTFSSELLKPKFFFICHGRLKKYIREEVEAQINRFEELGFKPYHIDSHRHIHTRIPVFLTIKNVLLLRGFNSIRISRNIKENGFSLFSSLYKKILNDYIISKVFPVHSSYMCSLSDWLAIGKEKKNIEVMVHPDVDSEGRIFDRLHDFQDYRIETVSINK